MGCNVCKQGTPESFDLATVNNAQGGQDDGPKAAAKTGNFAMVF
jgi:hypothetical protein